MQKKQSLAAETTVAQHLALVAEDGGAGEVLDQHFIGQAAQMDAQPGVRRMATPMPGVGQPADDGLLLRGARRSSSRTIWSSPIVVCVS